MLAYWLTEMDLVRADPSGHRIWRILESPTFAEQWYAAREAGERLRATVLTKLYANWAHPGGRYPDPREDAPFSPFALLGAAARSLDTEILQLPASPASSASSASSHPGQPGDIQRATPRGKAAPTHTGAPTPPLVWLMTYPQSHNTLPTLTMREETPSAPQARLYFELACLIGYVSREEPRLLDPDAPPGMTLLPTDPGIVSILHQFAIALLHLERDCPAVWTCQCNLVRQRFTAPPAAHMQPTDTMSLADLSPEANPDQSQ